MLSTNALSCFDRLLIRCLQEEVCRLKELLAVAYQELYGQRESPTLSFDTDHTAVAIDLDSALAVDVTVDNRPQQRTRAVLLQPCLTSSKTPESIFR